MSSYKTTLLASFNTTLPSTDQETDRTTLDSTLIATIKATDFNPFLPAHKQSHMPALAVPFYQAFATTDQRAINTACKQTIDTAFFLPFSATIFPAQHETFITTNQ